MLNKIKDFIVNIFNKIIGIKRYDFKSYSIMLLAIVYVIGFIGVYLISILQDSDENMAQKQVAAYAVGFFLILIVSMIDYHFIGKYFIVLYLISLGLLLICRYSNSYPIYGWAHYDARRWIKIGGDPTAGINNTGFEFMPSEITKMAMIVFIAKFFDVCYKKIKKIWVMLLAMIFMAIPTFLIMIQTDLSTSIVLMAMFAVMLFASEVPMKFILPFIIVGVPLGAGLFWYVIQPDQILLKPYQQKRILAALYPEMFPELTYQQDNAASAIRSGGMIGKMLSGDTGVRGTTYVPVKESDFIFTAVAEEFGFIGSILIIVMYLILILLIIRIIVFVPGIYKYRGCYIIITEYRYRFTVHEFRTQCAAHEPDTDRYRTECQSSAEDGSSCGEGRIRIFVVVKKLWGCMYEYWVYCA